MSQSLTVGTATIYKADQVGAPRVPLLGLSNATTRAEDAFIKSNLHPPPGGSLSFDLDVLLPLFGLVTPIGTSHVRILGRYGHPEQRRSRCSQRAQPRTLILCARAICFAALVSRRQ
jgi:hypothetical protein